MSPALRSIQAKKLQANEPVEVVGDAPSFTSKIPNGPELNWHILYSEVPQVSTFRRFRFMHFDHSLLSSDILRTDQMHRTFRKLFLTTVEPFPYDRTRIF